MEKQELDRELIKTLNNKFSFCIGNKLGVSQIERKIVKQIANNTNIRTNFDKMMISLNMFLDKYCDKLSLPGYKMRTRASK